LLTGLFVICNAILCSIAVWNYSLVHTTPTLQVDVYLIFLGAFGLATIFTLIFAEILCNNPFTTRVWFECGWAGLFWIMELVGAAAVTAIEPDLMCGNPVTAVACTSEHVLLAFTWICTIILLLYLLLLIFTVVTHQRDDPGVWNSSIRDLRFVTARQCLSSAPSSPSAPRFKKRTQVDIYTPQPLRPAPVPNYLHRAGLGSEYEIESFRPSFSATEHMEVESSWNLPEAVPLPSAMAAPVRPAPAMASSARLHSLTSPYPASGQRNIPKELPSSIVYAGQARPSPPTQSTSLPSPSPLGNWPQRDIMEQPVKSRRRPPPSAFEFPKRHTTEPTSASSPPDPSSQPRPRRPSGPRMRTPSADSTLRPAPLDLSGISNHDYTQRTNV
ncbi:hypothetical protein BU15DRAFT_40329, partial [Melanogaster broomeanus]